MINGNYVGVWERLQQYPAFVNEFNKYNHKLKNALTILSEQKHDIQGREKEVKRLAQIMERPKTPVAALLGQAGVGKSALVEDFIKRIGRNEVTSVPGREYFVVSLRVGSLKAMGNDALQSALSNMLTELKALETLAKRTLNNNKIRLILFIDEFHMLVTIFGPGTKIGGDLMKDLLARPPIRVIAATTRKEFDSTIAVDEPFKERFKEIQLNELPTNVVLNICKNWWLSNTKIPIPSDDIFIKVLLANKAYRAQQAEPRKSLDILEDMVAYVMINRNRITEQVIDDIFKERFHINLNLDFDAEAIFANVKSKVKGQTLALYELHRALRAVTYKINKNPNKPIMTLLFSGPTGVGKALPMDDVTPTIDGFKFNKDIVVGDILFDRYGKPTKVLGVYPQGSRDVYKITFADGRSMVADGDHLFSYYTYKQRTKINLNQYINEIPKLNTKSVKELLADSVLYKSKNGKVRPNYYIPNNGAVDYTKKMFHADPYVIGALLGEGCLTDKSLTISSGDEELVLEVSKHLNFKNKIKRNPSNYTWYFAIDDINECKNYITSHNIKNIQRDWILKDVLELSNTKSDTKFIPEIYKFGSIEQRWSLIQGLFDTDGSIENDAGKRYNVSFTSISEKLVKDVQEVLYSLGVSSTICMDSRYLKDKKRKPAYKLHVKASAKTKQKFFRLSRKLAYVDNAIKFEKLKIRIKKFDFIGISNIEKLHNQKETVCFLVDNDEHLFQTTKQYIVTHNTETVKAIEEVLYPNENVLQIFNMPDYKLPESEPVFRKNLGEKIRHQPNSIILLDEFEKASDDIKNSMLAILDEGIVNFNVVNREGLIEVQQVSLRNTIIIATTNAGHQIFKNNAEFSLITDGATLTPQAKSEYEKLKGELVEFLKVEGFKPEMLNRFNRIIPYRNLTKNVMINISEKIMQNCFDNFYKTKGIIIETPEKQLFNVDGQDIYTTDLAIYLAVVKANSENSDSGGARRLKTIFEAEIEDELIDHFAEHPQCKRFKIYVSKDSRVYDSGASYTKGGIIVDAIY